MTETLQYQSFSTLPHVEKAVLCVRRRVLLRRYGRLLSLVTLLTSILSNVRDTLSCGALAYDALRRSR